MNKRMLSPKRKANALYQGTPQIVKFEMGMSIYILSYLVVALPVNVSFNLEPK